MEATGAVKDAPEIRELLDEALGARIPSQPTKDLRSLPFHVKSPKLFLLRAREVQDHCGSPTLRIRSWKRGSERRLSPNRRPNPNDPGAAL